MEEAVEEVKAVKRAGFERKRAEESRNLKLCLACSIGGHFTEMLELKDVYEKYEHFFVTNPGKQTISILKNKKKYFMPERKGKKMNFLKQFFLSLKILLIEKPDVIITTGSGDMFWICVLGKLFRKKIIYIESFARVTNPSKFGKFVYIFKFADLFIYQWEKLKRHYPKGVYGGWIFDFSRHPHPDKCNNLLQNGDNISYFVTVGTSLNDFSRLLKKVDDLIEQKIIKGEVFAQIGHSKYIPKNYEWCRFLSEREFEEIIKRSELIITHDGAGSISKGLKYKKPMVIVPRLKIYGEISYDNKFELAKELEERFGIPVVEEIDNIDKALESISSLKCSVLSTNRKMIEIIERALKTFEMNKNKV